MWNVNNGPDAPPGHPSEGPPLGGPQIAERSGADLVPYVLRAAEDVQHAIRPGHARVRRLAPHLWSVAHRTGDRVTIRLFTTHAEAVAWAHDTTRSTP